MVIEVMKMVKVYIGINIPSAVTLVIVEQDLILKGEADIGLRPDTLPYITEVDVENCWVYRFLLVLLTKNSMMTRDLDIGLIPATLPPITQVGVVYILGHSFYSRPVEKSAYCDERVDISGGNGSRGFRSQETSHYYFHNHVESVYGDVRGEDRYQTSQSYSHNPGDRGILLGLTVAFITVKNIFIIMK